MAFDEYQTLLGTDKFNQIENHKHHQLSEKVPLKDIILARDCFFLWTLVGYASWGVVVVLYTNFFYDVIDKGNYSNASFYSTTSLSIYAIVSFICSPIVATLSDSIGRKPIMVMAAFTEAYTTIIAGLIPNNFVYICMMGLQGGGDASQATGLSLLADCVIAAPKGFYGSEKDSRFSRWMHSLITSKINKRIDSLNNNKEGIDEEDNGDDMYIQQELNTQFTMVLILQTVGLVIGIGFGDLMYLLTSSYQWSIACGGIICLPCCLHLFFVMPETVAYEDRKPFSSQALTDSIFSQITSLDIFISNKRLMGLCFVNFLVQFASSGIIGVILYWGEWKFGWKTNSEAIVQFLVISAGLIGATMIAIYSQWEHVHVSTVIAGSCVISAVSCVPVGLLSMNWLVMFCCFMMGTGFGNAPALFAQIGAEVPKEVQGRVQGFNYAVMTVAWAAGPIIYWWMFSAHIDESKDHRKHSNTHINNAGASLFWWVSAVLLFLAGFVMYFFAGDLTSSKLKRIHSGG